MGYCSRFSDFFFLSMAAVCLHSPFIGAARIEGIMELLSGYKLSV